jgi:hypothetical protein
MRKFAQRLRGIAGRIVTADEQQRKLRSKVDDPDNLLSKIYKKFNEKWKRPIPYHGARMVTIYRGVPKKFKDQGIRPGDWVALSKRYAKEHGGVGSIVIKEKVPAKHVYWAGTDENEWWYTPH